MRTLEDCFRCDVEKRAARAGLQQRGRSECPHDLQIDCLVQKPRLAQRERTSETASHCCTSWQLTLGHQALLASCRLRDPPRSLRAVCRRIGDELSSPCSVRCHAWHSMPVTLYPIPSQTELGRAPSADLRRVRLRAAAVPLLPRHHPDAHHSLQVTAGLRAGRRGRRAGLRTATRCWVYGFGWGGSACAAIAGTHRSAHAPLLYSFTHKQDWQGGFWQFSGCIHRPIAGMD